MLVRVRVGHVRMIALFANKWHIAMYENAKVVCSVLELGPRHSFCNVCAGS